MPILLFLGQFYRTDTILTNRGGLKEIIEFN